MPPKRHRRPSQWLSMVTMAPVVGPAKDAAAAELLQGRTADIRVITSPKAYVSPLAILIPHISACFWGRKGANALGDRPAVLI